jgi:putative SOS response-associated peptidase YedK
MCANYKSVTQLDHLVSFFGVTREQHEVPPEFSPEIWPLGLAPFIVLDEQGRRRVAEGHWGLLPHFAKEVKYGRQTYNARSETVHEKVSYKTAWKRGQRCIIPVEVIYEPCYETGVAVRWAMEQPGKVPMGVAGVWSEKHPWLTRKDGRPLPSFTMLTVNADGHPVFQRMHGPNDEKRMPVILHEKDYDTWLICSPEDAASFFKQFDGPLHAYAKPLVRKPKADKPTTEKTPRKKKCGDLFPPVQD